MRRLRPCRNAFQPNISRSRILSLCILTAAILIIIPIYKRLSSTGCLTLGDGSTTWCVRQWGRSRKFFEFIFPFERSTALCHDEYAVDISDPFVSKLKIPDRPSFPLKAAWFKCEAARYGRAPEDIPLPLFKEFTMNKSIPVKKFYFDEASLGNTSLAVWTEVNIQNLMKKVGNRHEKFNYDTKPIYELFDARPDLVSNKICLVIGSRTPWLESLLLFFGAREIHTLEFGSIFSQDKRIKTFTPELFKMKFLNDLIPPYDCAFSYSSLEHDGLGRYGDILNPIGDLQSMSRLLSVVKPGGHVAIGVPCCHDRLEWNAHRIYGPMRLPLLFSGFKILGVYPRDSRMSQETGYEFQPIWLLKNQLACEEDLRVSSIFASATGDRKALV